jgi:ankyrin repeat protein
MEPTPVQSLYYAVRVGDLQKVKKLIKSGVNVDGKGAQEDTCSPLHLAAFNGYSNHPLNQLKFEEEM